MSRRVISAAFLLLNFFRGEKIIMTLKMNPQQFQRVQALIYRLCCNYDDEYCIALDDGEPCHCIQEISECSVYCNYFKNAVLPADKKLYAEIVMHSKGNP